MPLAQFAGVNLHDIRSVEFKFDQRDTGALLFSDIAFANSPGGGGPTPTPGACGSGNYTVAQSAGASIEPGTARANSSCDNCAVAIAFPDNFTYSLYGQTYDHANASSNGNLQFATANTSYHLDREALCYQEGDDVCLRAPDFGPTIFAYWGNLWTNPTDPPPPPPGKENPTPPDRGIYTSMSGQAPNRIFNIEWRNVLQFETYDCPSYRVNVSFEIRLYEGQEKFEIIYGSVQNGSNVAVGVQKGDAPGDLYVEYSCDTSNSLQNGRKLTFTRLPVCTPTPVPPPPTNTYTPTYTHTPTNTPTPTACPSGCGYYADVPLNDPFQAYIHCLSCSPTPPATPVIGGYPCGGEGEPCVCNNLPYFRPGAYVTRGQLAKMVSVAAGYTDVIFGQSLEDVPPTNTFYVFIERLYRRGHMTGYPCGGAGEPCVPPGNRPYFRIYNNATRGQIAKVISNAKGYSDMPTVQTFEDVAVGSTFYVWVERVRIHNLMGGYPCGGPGEPCGIGNKPYFRPNNDTTRAQASKAISRAWFASCNPGGSRPDIPIETPYGTAPPLATLTPITTITVPIWTTTPSGSSTPNIPSPIPTIPGPVPSVPVPVPSSLVTLTPLTTVIPTIPIP